MVRTRVRTRLYHGTTPLPMVHVYVPVPLVPGTTRYGVANRYYGNTIVLRPGFYHRASFVARLRDQIPKYSLHEKHQVLLDRGCRQAVKSCVTLLEYVLEYHMVHVYHGRLRVVLGVDWGFLVLCFCFGCCLSSCCSSWRPYPRSGRPARRGGLGPHRETARQVFGSSGAGAPTSRNPLKQRQLAMG